MKRIWVCFILLLVSASLCVCSFFTVKHASSKETAALKEVLTCLQQEEFEKAKTALKQCRGVWKQTNLAFYLFYHHDLFEQVDADLSAIELYMETDPGYAKARLGACISVMEDMVELQRINVKNIF